MTQLRECTGNVGRGPVNAPAQHTRRLADAGASGVTCLSVALVILLAAATAPAAASRHAAPAGDSLQSESGETLYPVQETRGGNQVWVCYSASTHQPFTGVSVKKYPNGQIERTCEFQNGRPNGIRREWYEDGTRMAVTSLKDDVRHGPEQRWYANGQMSLDGAYWEGWNDGPLHQWWDDGKPRFTAFYRAQIQDQLMDAWKKKPFWAQYADCFVRGIPEGEFTYWYANGQKQMEGETSSDYRLLRLSIWSETGEEHPIAPSLLELEPQSGTPTAPAPEVVDLPPPEASAAPGDARERAAERVGVYDSRAVAVAFVGSNTFDAWMGALAAERDRARAAGDLARVVELEAAGNARQARLHQQAFSTEPVDDLLGQIGDRLPEIAKSAGVDLLVSKWNKAALDQHQDAELVDVTMALVDALRPTESQRARAIDIQKSAPLPREQAELLQD